MAEQQKNPLSSFMRRPKMFLKLPSGGKFWPEGSLEFPENGELPVYGLTAKDELLIRTPDALFNGRTTVDVIQSCVPNIKNAWAIPSIDLDAILIAIRIATYGEKMTMSVNIPGFQEAEPYEIDLRPILDKIIENTLWDESVTISGDMTVYIAPVSYKVMTDYNLLSFDSNRILATLIRETEITEEQRVNLTAQAMNTIADATLMQMINGIYKIETVEGNTTNPEHIKEFLNNVDKDIFSKISDAFRKLNNHNNDRTLTVQTPPQYVEKGAPAEVTVPFEFDYSSFFDQGF
jgi:hypothetical protein